MSVAREEKKVDRALMLAAGVGQRLSPVSDALPKVLLLLGGKTLLQRHLEHLTALGIPELVMVVGYQAARIRREVTRHTSLLPVRFLHNPRYEEGSILSLWTARPALEGSVLFMDGDLLYPRCLLASVAQAPAATSFLVDPRPLEADGEEIKVLARKRRALYIGRKWPADPGRVGEWVGIAKFGGGVAERLRTILEEFIKTGQTGSDYEDAMNAAIQGAEAGVVSVAGLPWVEIDFPEDLERAQELLPAIETLDRAWGRKSGRPAPARRGQPRKGGERGPKRKSSGASPPRSRG